MILNYPKSNFSLQMIKSTYRKCQQFRMWLFMPNLIQLEILVSDLSFLKVITTCKKQRHLLILSGDINDQSIIKSNCQAHFDDNFVFVYETNKTFNFQAVFNPAPHFSSIKDIPGNFENFVFSWTRLATPN